MMSASEGGGQKILKCCTDLIWKLPREEVIYDTQNETKLQLFNGDWG